MTSVLDRFVLRGAGFPVTDAMLSAAGQSAGTAMELTDVEDDLTRLAPVLVEWLARGDLPRADRQRLKRRLRGRRWLPLAGSTAELAEVWNTLVDRREDLVDRLHKMIHAELAAAEAYLRDWCARPRTEEAVWTMRPGAAESLGRFAEGRAGGAWLSRLALRYLQRFAAKNETTSFCGPFQFGPVAAAEGRSGALLDYDSASPRLGARFTSCSRFVVDELAELAAMDLADHPDLPLRLHLGARVVDDILEVAGHRIRLSPELSRAMRDEQLSESLLPEAARPALRRLRRLGIVRPGLAPAATSLRALADLTDAIHRLPGASDWLSFLADVRSAVDRLQRASWPDRAQQQKALTDHLAMRGVRTERPSGLYADRSVTFDEHCGGLRGLRLDPTSMDAYLPALTAILRVHAAHAKAVRERTRSWWAQQWCDCGLPRRTTVAKLLAATGERPLPNLDPAIGPDDELWSRLDRLAPETAARVQLSADAVVAAFADRLPTEPFVCSPDLMIQHVHGRDRLVLGEVHHGVQVWNWLVATLPQAERDLLANRLADWAARLAGPYRIATVVEPRRTGKTFTLELPGLAIERMARANVPRGLVRSLGQLTVDRDTTLISDDDGPLVLAPSSPVDPLVRAYGSLVLWGPRDPGLRGHRPRVVVDDVVWLRESWRLSTEDVQRLASARGVAEAVRVVGRLRRDTGMPRHVFVRADTEPKPIYADLDSAAYVGLLAATVRAPGVGMVVTEMLPGPDELALRCADGTFTSELRTSILVEP